MKECISDLGQIDSDYSKISVQLHTFTMHTCFDSIHINPFAPEPPVTARADPCPF